MIASGGYISLDPFLWTVDCINKILTGLSFMVRLTCLSVSIPYSKSFVAEPVYRLAEKEWKDFVEVFTELLVEADPQVPPLPPKDVIHRIYRDVRGQLSPRLCQLFC